MNIITPVFGTLALFLLITAIINLAHEAGHYAAARLLKVRVLGLSLGLGRELLERTYGGTEYRLRLFPFAISLDIEGFALDAQPTGGPGDFQSRPPWHRIAILGLGPAANILLAVSATAATLMLGSSEPAYLSAPVVVGAIAPGSPAETAGIAEGDRIESVDGNAVPTWSRFETAIAARADRPTELRFSRDGQMATVLVTPRSVSQYQLGEVGIFPEMTPVVAMVLPESPAARAGLRQGDSIVLVAGTKVPDAIALRAALAQHPGKSVELVVNRQGTELRLTVTPVVVDDEPRIGVQLGQRMNTLKPTPLQALLLSVRETTQQTAFVLRGLVTTVIPIPALPDTPGRIAFLGPPLTSELALLALLSLSLGVLNLIPFLAASDATQVGVILLEKARGRRFSPRVLKVAVATFTVTAFLSGLFTVLTDLTRIEWLRRLFTGVP